MRLESVQEPTSTSGVRRSGRISKEIPIILSGDDTDGRQFADTTRTLVLSRHGASVLSQHKLIPEQEIYLRPIDGNREVEVRVCGQIGEREDGYIYGVAFVNPSVDFWGIEFPPAEKLGKDLTRVTLECINCRLRVTVQFDPMEMDVYMVNEGALRFCKRCLASTKWKLTKEEATPEAAAPVVATPPALKVEIKAEPKAQEKPKVEAAPEGPAPVAAKVEAEVQTREKPKVEAPPLGAAPTTPPENRRKERRAMVKMTACIRSPGADDEVVTCEDMSRSGFSFRSKREYSVEAMIEVAIPYSPGSIPMFAPAQIRNVRKIPHGDMYRYGAAHVISARK